MQQLYRRRGTLRFYHQLFADERRVDNKPYFGHKSQEQMATKKQKKYLRSETTVWEYGLIVPTSGTI
jgi:hypothetical protein